VTQQRTVTVEQLHPGQTNSAGVVRCAGPRAGVWVDRVEITQTRQADGSWTDGQLRLVGSHRQWVPAGQKILGALVERVPAEWLARERVLLARSG